LASSDHPVESEDVSISTMKLKKFVGEIRKAIESDITSRSDFDTKSSEWYRRRYQLEDQNPTYPFVGSSNITMPLIDLQIDKSKPPIMNLYSIDPIVTFKPQAPSHVNSARGAERVMQWLLTSRMRNFEDNMEIGADHKGQYGFVVFKTIYEWETRLVTETITQEVFSEEDRQTLSEAFVLRASNPEASERVDEQISIFIKNKFNLNPDDDIDRIAMDAVLEFIQDPKGEEITIKRNMVVKHQPYTYPVEPQFLYTQRGTKSLQDAERIVEIKFCSENDLRIRGKSGFYDDKEVKRAIRELEESAQQGQTETRLSQSLNVERARREGVFIEAGEEAETIEVHEVYCMYDIDGDGIKEKCLLELQPQTGAVFRFVEYPYAHGEWPYVQIKNELTGDRFLDARGIPEILDHIDREVTANHRAKINRMMIANAPTFKYRLGSNLNPNNINWIPGQFYPVVDMDDFEPVTMPNLDFSFDREEAILNTWVERRLGSVEAALTNPEQLSEARTRAEIEAVSAIGQQALSLNIRRWQRGMQKVYKHIWDLQMQYGENELLVPMSDGSLMAMTKHEIVGDFDIVPMGTIGTSNPGQEQQQAIQIFQFLKDLAQSGATQLMPQIEINLGEALVSALKKANFVEASRVIRERSPEEVKQIMQAQAQRAQLAQAVEDNIPTSPREMKAGIEELQKRAPNGKSQRVRL